MTTVEETTDEAVALMLFIEENCPELKRIQRQLTAKTATALCNQHDLEYLKRLLMTMENKVKRGKYRDLYTTILDWISNDIKWGRYVAKRSVNTEFNKFSQPSKEKLFHKQFPVGSTIESTTTKVQYEVGEVTLNAKDGLGVILIGHLKDVNGKFQYNLIKK